MELEVDPDLHVIASQAQGDYVTDRVGAPGWDIWVKAEELDARRVSLEDAGITLVSAEAVDALRLLRGIPRIDTDFGDFTLPQEAGLKERAVAFGKGCYQGQEAIVMLEHRGRPPKRLVRLQIEGENVPEARAPLRHGDRDVGFVTSAAHIPNHGVLALGYLKRAHVDLNEVTVDGALAVISPLA